MYKIKCWIVRIVHALYCPIGEVLAVRWNLMDDSERHHGV